MYVIFTCHFQRMCIHLPHSRNHYSNPWEYQLCPATGFGKNLGIYRGRLSQTWIINLALGCRGVILLRPKMGVEPPKHDVISMPTQQYTNTNYTSLERYYLVVVVELYGPNQNIQWQFELPRSENQQNFWGWLTILFSHIRQFFYKYSDNKRSVQNEAYFLA